MARNEGFTYRERIDARAAGRGILDWLAARHAHSSREVWRERLAAGELRLDGRPPLADDRLVPGQELIWHRPPWDEPEVPLAYGIVHEDAALLAVSKPSGLPTMAGGGFHQSTLQALVRRDFGDAAPLHRLGRGTSGLVLFARSEQARTELSAAFRERRIRKVYRALASGEPPWERLEIRAPIGEVEHPILGAIHAVSAAGRPSLSRAAVVERRGDSCLLDVEIETGRPHQIRIHLAAVDHPLVGDPLYGPGGLPAPDALPGDLGYHLHAWTIGFVHPVTGAAMELEAPPPELLLPGRS